MAPVGEKVGWSNLTWDAVTSDTWSTESPQVSTCRTANLSALVESQSDLQKTEPTIFSKEIIIAFIHLIIHTNYFHNTYCVSTHLSSVVGEPSPAFQLWLKCSVGVQLACNPCMQPSLYVYPKSRTGTWCWPFPCKPSAGQTHCIHSNLHEMLGYGKNGAQRTEMLTKWETTGMLNSLSLFRYLF